jgi:hypothetical protein
MYITKVNTIEDQYACDSYSLPAIVGQGDYYTASGGQMVRDKIISTLFYIYYVTLCLC